MWRRRPRWTLSSREGAAVAAAALLPVDALAELRRRLVRRRIVRRGIWLLDVVPE